MSVDYPMGDRIIEGGILLVAFLTLLGGFLKAIYGKIDRTERSIQKKIDSVGDKVEEAEREVEETIENVRDEVGKTRVWSEQEFVIMRKEVGESLAAIRQKVHEVEKEALENYVRRDEFERSITRIEDSVKDGVKDLKGDFKELRERLQTHLEDKGRRQN